MNETKRREEYDGISLLQRSDHKSGGSDCSLTFIMCIVVLANNNHNNNISYNYILVGLHLNEGGIQLLLFNSVLSIERRSIWFSVYKQANSMCQRDYCKHLKVSFLYEMNLSKFYLWHCHSWHTPKTGRWGHFKVNMFPLYSIYSTVFIHTHTHFGSNRFYYKIFTHVNVNKELNFM